MFRRTLVAIVALAITAAVAASAAGSASPRRTADLDCTDFQTQAAAQQVFINQGGPLSDPFSLDGDGDGVACETLPCPCAGPGEGGGGSPPPAQHARMRRATVVDIADGDTIRVRTRHGSKGVRLIGIDTPEVYGGTECGGPAASRAMKHMLHPGDRVKLTTDPSQDSIDRYGRLLRYVEHGGIDLGRKQILRGRAHVYVYEGRPFARTSSYRRAQRIAKRSHRGNWGRCDGHFK